MRLLPELILRYSLRGRRKGFARVVAWISMLGMVLGVTSLVTVMSVMNGFAQELESRILALVPHTQVTATRGQVADWSVLAGDIEKVLTVDAIAPFITDQVLLEGWGRQRGVSMTGIDLRAQQRVSGLHDHMVAGELSALETERFSVVLGETLGRLLGVNVGDTVSVTLPTLAVTPLGVFPRTKQLVVRGFFKVGADLDVKQAYVSLDTARRLFSRAGVDGVQLHFQHSSRSDAASRVLERHLAPGFRVTDWRATQGSLFTAVRMEKITVAALLLAVVMVAAFNIVSTLTMSVTEKRSDIAVLRIMGLSSGQIMWVFMGQGVVLGGVGILLGTVLGVSLALSISDIVLWAEQLSGTPIFDPRVYYIGRLPSLLQWSDVFATGAVAMLLSLVATAYPAWRASKIHPVEVLNHV